MQSSIAHQADPVVPVLLALVVLSFAALIGGQLMKLLRQPAVLGELLMGLLVGNLAYALRNPGITVLREGENLKKIADLALSSNVTLSEAALKVLPAGAPTQRIADILSGTKGLDFVAVYSFVDLVSRIAILVLLFLVGLETDISEMKRVGRTALSVAVVGVVVPLALGLVTMEVLQPDSFWARDLFVGGILTATSVGIIARVLRDLGQGARDEARVILGAAVLDDVLSLVVLAVVTGLVVTGTISVGGVAWITAKASLFLGGAVLIGVWMTPWCARRLSLAGIRNVKLTSGCIFAFFLAWLANGAGLAPIVGAFAAGMILKDFFDKEMEGQSLRELLSPLESLVVPLFFVWVGIQVKLEILANRNVLKVGLALTAVAILGKVVSGFVCPKRMNRLAVGLGMVPRGEVGLIFAGIGKGLGVIDDGLFSAVVFLVMITTILAPPALRWRLSPTRL
jgi:Kef-type K+ transport system membrane component KefB